MNEVLVISYTLVLQWTGLTSNFILLFFLDFSSTGVALASRSISLSALKSAWDVDGRTRFLIFREPPVSPPAYSASYFAFKAS
jgi:hypothetical protein